METYIQIKTKGETYPGIIEIRIDDIDIQNYINYAIQTIKKLKATYKNQIEGYRFIERQIIDGKIKNNLTGWIYYGHKITNDMIAPYIKDKKFQETYNYYKIQLEEQEKIDNPDKKLEIIGICRLDSGNYTPMLKGDMTYPEFIKKYYIHQDLSFTPLNTPKIK